MDFSSIGIPELIEIAFIATLSGAAGWVMKGAKTVFDVAFLIFGWPFALIAFSMDLLNSLNSLSKVTAGLVLSALFFLFGFLVRPRVGR